MVRDEADIIGTVIAHLFASGVDHVIAADNLSTDRTRQILESFDDVTVVDDPEPGYYQSDKMTRLARMVDEGWVLPFDADEVWYPTEGHSLSDALSATDADVVLATGHDHIARHNPLTVADAGYLSPWRRTSPQKLAKVAFRAHADVIVAMGNHDVSHPGTRVQGVLEFRHYQYRTCEQMVRKLRVGAAAYAASDVDMRHGTHWREGGQLSDDAMQVKWDELASEEGLTFDPAPLLGQSVSVIIPTRDREDLLTRTVKAVAATTDAEIIVQQGEASFAQNCNRGALRATGDVLVFLNDDTVPAPGWLEALTRRVGWGVAGSHLTNPDGSSQHSGVFFRRNGTTLEAFNRTERAPSAEVPAVTGACLAITAADFEALGGFDEVFVNGYEDVDLCLRARRDGLRCVYAADSTVEHELSQSAGRFAHATQNIQLLNDRWGDLPI